jgi:hypothetical protein
MVIRPDLPRAIALLLSSGVALNPMSQNPTVVEVVGAIQTWHDFPIQLPSLNFFGVVVGGQMGQMYSAKVEVRNPSGEVIASKAIGELPFTSKIKRCIIAQGLLDMTKERVVTAPGMYSVELSLRGESLGATPLEIIKIEKPSNLPPDPS